MADSNKEKVEQLIQDGLVHHDAGNVEQARDAYLQALEFEPEPAKALDLAGLLGMQQSRLQPRIYSSAVKRSR